MYHSITIVQNRRCVSPEQQHQTTNTKQLPEAHYLTLKAEPCSTNKQQNQQRDKISIPTSTYVFVTYTSHRNIWSTWLCFGISEIQNKSENDVTFIVSNPLVNVLIQWFVLNSSLHFDTIKPTTKWSHDKFLRFWDFLPRWWFNHCVVVLLQMLRTWHFSYILPQSTRSKHCAA